MVTSSRVPRCGNRRPAAESPRTGPVPPPRTARPASTLPPRQNSAHDACPSHSLSLKQPAARFGVATLPSPACSKGRKPRLKHAKKPKPRSCAGSIRTSGLVNGDEGSGLMRPAVARTGTKTKGSWSGRPGGPETYLGRPKPPQISGRKQKHHYKQLAARTRTPTGNTNSQTARPFLTGSYLPQPSIAGNLSVRTGAATRHRRHGRPRQISARPVNRPCRFRVCFQMERGLSAVMIPDMSIALEQAAPVTMAPARRAAALAPRRTPGRA